MNKSEAQTKWNEAMSAGDYEAAERISREMAQRKRIARLRRQARDAAYRDCGLVKVRGAMGGTYWE